MASHSFIMSKETEIISAQLAARDSFDALIMEESVNGGFILPENRDVWNTLFVNAQDLRKKLDKLIERLDKAL